MNRPFAPSPGLKGPTHYWAVMRAAENGFRVREVAGCSSGPAFQTVKDYVRRLVGMGAIELLGEDAPVGRRNAARVYRVKIPTVHAPVIRRDTFTGKRGQMQEQIWNTLREGESYDLRYLALAASTDVVQVSFGTVREYVRKLALAGLVLVEKPYVKGAPGRKPGARAGLYRLKPSANTGPKALKVIGNRIYDPNQDRMVGEPLDGSEVSA